jgi:hypothetical protein
MDDPFSDLGFMPEMAKASKRASAAPLAATLTLDVLCNMQQVLLTILFV